METSLRRRRLTRKRPKLSVTEAGLLFAQHAQRILDVVQETTGGARAVARCVAQRRGR
ncbi:hypothetical protein [Pantoea sp. AS142]|uniref:hypothetical protein n=1 Tax=Pantoea sp. AS142 TaxID=3081292 RepID=UPI003015A609